MEQNSSNVFTKSLSKTYKKITHADGSICTTRMAAATWTSAPDLR